MDIIEWIHTALLRWHTSPCFQHQAFSLVRSESNPRAWWRMALIDQCYQLGLSIPPATFQNYAGWFASKLYKIVKHCVPKLPSIAPNSSQFYHCLRPYGSAHKPTIPTSPISSTTLHRIARHGRPHCAQHTGALGSDAPWRKPHCRHGGSNYGGVERWSFNCGIFRKARVIVRNGVMVGCYCRIRIRWFWAMQFSSHKLHVRLWDSIRFTVRTVGYLSK